jgi:hypothetical protein
MKSLACAIVRSAVSASCSAAVAGGCDVSPCRSYIVWHTALLQVQQFACLCCQCYVVTVPVPESKTSCCYGTCPWKQNLTLLRYLSLKAKPHVVTVPVTESKTSRCYGTCHWKQNLTLLRYLSLKCSAGMKAGHCWKDLQSFNTSFNCRTTVLPPRHKFSCVHVEALSIFRDVLTPSPPPAVFLLY